MPFTHNYIHHGSFLKKKRVAKLRTDRLTRSRWLNSSAPGRVKIRKSDRKKRGSKALKPSCEDCSLHLLFCISPGFQMHIYHGSVACAGPTAPMPADCADAPDVFRCFGLMGLEGPAAWRPNFARSARSY